MTKILNHISFARDWLTKAENKIRAGDLTDGELFLSLAEAEIRKAWENSILSRKKVSRSKKIFNFKKVILTGLVIIVFSIGFTYLKSSFTEPEQIKLSLLDHQEERIDLHKQGQPRLINVDLKINKGELIHEESSNN